MIQISHNFVLFNIFIFKTRSSFWLFSLNYKYSFLRTFQLLASLGSSVVEQSGLQSFILTLASLSHIHTASESWCIWYALEIETDWSIRVSAKPEAEITRLRTREIVHAKGHNGPIKVDIDARSKRQVLLHTGEDVLLKTTLLPAACWRIAVKGISLPELVSKDWSGGGTCFCSEIYSYGIVGVALYENGITSK